MFNQIVLPFDGSSLAECVPPRAVAVATFEVPMVARTSPLHRTWLLPIRHAQSDVLESTRDTLNSHAHRGPVAGGICA